MALGECVSNVLFFTHIGGVGAAGVCVFHVACISDFPAPFLEH